MTVQSSSKRNERRQSNQSAIFFNKNSVLEEVLDKESDVMEVEERISGNVNGVEKIGMTAMVTTGFSVMFAISVSIYNALESNIKKRNTMISILTM